MQRLRQEASISAAVLAVKGRDRDRSLPLYPRLLQRQLELPSGYAAREQCVPIRLGTLTRGASAGESARFPQSLRIGASPGLRRCASLIKGLLQPKKTFLACEPSHASLICFSSQISELLSSTSRQRPRAPDAPSAERRTPVAWHRGLA